MAEPEIIVAKEGGVLRITLNRPDKLNSMTASMATAFLAALRDAAADDEVRALLVTGAGKAFCAGQDLAEVAVPEHGADIDLGATVEAYYNPIVRALRSLEKPIVCAVNGVAAGAGANLALACDIVVAARGAKLTQVFSRIGLIPDSGGTFILPRLVGPARATALAMLAVPVTAEEAERMGMIWRAVDDDALAGEAEALAAKLARMPTRGLGITKRLMNRSLANDLDAQLDLERDGQAEAGRTADYAEGVGAFFDKRKPEFTGR